MNLTEKIAEFTAEKISLEEKLAVEQNQNICVALRHNLAVCNKEIDLLTREKVLFDKSVELKNQLLNEFDNDQTTFFNSQIVSLQAQANAIHAERERLGDELEKYDLDYIYELMGDKSM